ncbi:DUF6980 family protein [Edaphobacter modestus]|uniref:DUF6980 domain-containing protein n=1 Tax=Edaphobacter modestus TaxID=388466 RepID=A0A4Q7YTL8_9BACT|nr:hypothetical protein [Edaphobacter modestus]RZU40289.1 hypothetical protein BDD14_1735 [Edaphobacter modestus]
MSTHCCERMTLLLNDGEGAAIIYNSKFDEYGIPVLDGGSSYITLEFCPWCGAKLPPSKRDEYFGRLEG